MKHDEWYVLVLTLVAWIDKEDIDTMRVHLYKFSFMGGCTNWYKHGELRKIKSRFEVYITSHDIQIAEDINPFIDMIHDIRR